MRASYVIIVVVITIHHHHLIHSQDAVWEAWNLVTSTGLQFSAVNTPNRTVCALTTITGVLFAATLTGFVVDGVTEQLNGVREGRQAVQEWGHTLLIGWTDRSVAFIKQVGGLGGRFLPSFIHSFIHSFYLSIFLIRAGRFFFIIHYPNHNDQVCLANASGGGGVIVVMLTEKGTSKAEIEKQFYINLSSTKELLGTSIVFRRGSPMNVADLRNCAADTARG